MGNSTSDFSPQGDGAEKRSYWMRRYSVLSDKLTEHRAKLGYPSYPQHSLGSIPCTDRERSSILDTRVDSAFTGGFTVVEVLLVTEDGRAWERNMHLTDLYSAVMLAHPDGFELTVDTN